MCNQFFVFDAILLEDEDFFTNFVQVAGGVSLNTDGENIYLDYDSLSPYSLSCLFYWDDYSLFSKFHTIFKWDKK